jgi:hypothetical protein
MVYPHNCSGNFCLVFTTERIFLQLRIQEKLTYDDLESDSSMQQLGTQLSLSRVERYLHGPMPGSSGEYNVSGQTGDCVA